MQAKGLSDVHNSDIAFRDVREGMFLFLGIDPLLSDRLATYLFCEPEQVIAIHRGSSPQERKHLHEDRIVVHARGFGER